MNAEEFIYQVLASRKEGCLLSVLSNYLSSHFKCTIEEARQLILQMFHEGKLISKPRVFRPGELTDSDILLTLPSNEAVKLPPNMNPHITLL